jgi:hypothetical protein
MGRAERLTVPVGDLHLDYSKNLVTDGTLRLLQELASAQGVTALRVTAAPIRRGRKTAPGAFTEPMTR